MTHALCATTLLVAAVLLSTPVSANQAALPGTADPAADIGDCDQSPDLDTREACYAALLPEAIEECESLRRFACAPYRDMHVAQNEHAAAVEALVAASAAAYDSYTGTDPTFLTDLVSRLHAADAAWATWRDAECALEPLLDGMSRSEASGLTEACRAEETRKRAGVLRERASRIGDPH